MNLTARDLLLVCVQVKLQYRLTRMGDAGPNLMTAEEIGAATMHEFESKARWANFFMLIIKRMVAFTFLLVFKTAYDYHKGFLTKFQHDNIFITSYFRRCNCFFRQFYHQFLLLRKVVLSLFCWVLVTAP